MSNQVSLEERIHARLLATGSTMATAESCTGGLIGHRLTQLPGISDFYLGGVVAYSNAVKCAILGVSAQTLAVYGAVSEAVAREMASGARRIFCSDYALSVTGIAGPGGGTSEKPVGLVYIALAGPSGVSVRECRFSGDRGSVKEQSATASLEMLEAGIE
jgi:PncC family amidohydrolase